MTDPKDKSPRADRFLPPCDGPGMGELRHVPFPDAPAGHPASGKLAQAPLYSVQDICRIFNRSARTVRAWCRAGHLKPVRVGKAVFFRPEDVEEMLDPIPADRRADATPSCLR